MTGRSRLLGQKEILAYLNKIADKYGLRSHLQLTPKSPPRTGRAKVHAGKSQLRPAKNWNPRS